MKIKAAKFPMKSRELSPSGKNESMVRMTGLEPVHLAALPPQSSVSANSTTCAATSHNEPIPPTVRKIKLTRCRVVFKTGLFCS
jgi:hypothetical protein